jgi:hypothetical protein
VLRSAHRIAGRIRITVLGAALLSGAALPAAGLWAGTASAGANCAPPVAGTITCTFVYTGSSTEWPVPAGITSVTVVADGGAGGAAFPTGTAGGAGGEYKATLTGIPAGTTLSVFPGGMADYFEGGTDAGRGGGNGTPADAGDSGGGGGASTVAISPYSVANLLVVAGGGGGAGAQNNPTENPPQPATGGNGGGSNVVDGADGSPGTAATIGHGGTTTAGGANGGATGCLNSATDGAQLHGGNSNNTRCTGNGNGGGGGSGYFGGGGSAQFAGAGGGSGFPATQTTIGGITVKPDTSDTHTNTGDGVITISYSTQAPTTTILTSSRNPSYFGQRVTFIATVSPTDGGGSVDFKNAAADITGCAARTLHLADGKYQATCNTRSLPVGADSITAVYTGDTAYAGSTGTLTQTIRRAPTRLTPDLAFNYQQTFTVYGTLDSLGAPVSGQRLTFSTGPARLCSATTNSRGVASCVLSYAQSIAIRQNSGRYAVAFAGTPGYYPSAAIGQAIILP